MFAWIAKLFRRTKPKPAIVLGVGYQEFELSQKLERSGDYQILFFIDDEPWNHRTKLGNAELRYPAELPALCANHDIAAVFYLEDRHVVGLSADLPLQKIT